MKPRPSLISHSFFCANAYSVYCSHIYNKTNRKAKPTIVNYYCTFGVSITELQVRYKRSLRMETGTHTHIYIYIYIYIWYIYIYIYYYGEVYQDVNVLLEVVSLFHSLLTIQIHLKLIYLDFIFMLHYEQRITQVCFNSFSIMDSDYHNAVFVYVYGQWITP